MPIPAHWNAPLPLRCHFGYYLALASGPSRSRSIDTLIERFDGDIRRILEQLAGEALVSAEILADELDEYLEDFSKSSLHMEFVDRDKAERCTTLCRGLLDALNDDATERQHRLTQLAVNYYVLAEDAADDKHSLAGFDDDLQVVEAVVEELGLNRLLDDDGER